MYTKRTFRCLVTSIKSTPEKIAFLQNVTSQRLFHYIDCMV